MVHAYLEKSELKNEEIEIIKQRALKAQEEFEALERKRNENKELHDNVTSTVFESKDEPTQMTKQSFTIIDFITSRKSIHFKLICKNVHN